MRIIRMRRSTFIIYLSLIASLSLLCVSKAAEAGEQEDLLVAKRAFEDGFYRIARENLARFLKVYPQSSHRQEAHLLIGQCYYREQNFLEALGELELALDGPNMPLKAEALYWIGEVHFKGEDYKEAANFYRKVIEKYPDSPYVVYAYYSLGFCFYRQRRFQEALDFFVKVSSTSPKGPLAKESQFKIAECLYNLKEYPKAKQYLSGYLAEFPDSERKQEAYFYLGESDYYLGNYSKAIENYQRAIKLSPHSATAALSQYGMGFSFLKLGNFQKALEIFDEGLQSCKRGDPLLDSFLFAKAESLCNLNRHQEAIKIYDELILKFPNSKWVERASLGKAEALEELGKLVEAASIYQHIKQISTKESFPGDFMDTVRYRLGWAYLKMGKYEESISEFQKVTKEATDTIVKVSALCQIGDIYLNEGKLQEAIDTYDKILKEHPESFYSDYAQYQLGTALLKSKRLEAATLAFQALLLNFPESRLRDKAHYQLGICYFYQGDFRTAKEEFQRILLDFPESELKFDALLQMGICLYNMAGYREAIEVFERVKEEARDEEYLQRANYEIGWCYYRLGKEKEALRRFNDFLWKFPDSEIAPDVQFWLGEYYYNKGRFSKARRNFGQLIERFPNSELVDEAHYWIAWSWYREENNEAARREFEIVENIHNSQLAADASLRIADILLEGGQQKKALEKYRSVCLKYEGSSFQKLAYKKIGEVLKSQGSYLEAIDTFKKAIDFSSDNLNAELQFLIGEALEDKGEDLEAANQYLKVFYLYPGAGYWAIKAQLRAASIFEESQRWDEAKLIYQELAKKGIEEAKFAKERLDWIQNNVSKK